MRIPTLNAAEYARALAARPVQSHAWLRLHRVDNTVSVPRLGMILSKKLTRTGVLRNALKRQIRVAFTNYCAQGAGQESADFVVRLNKIEQPATKAWEQRFGRAVQLLFKRQAALQAVHLSNTLTANRAASPLVTLVSQ